MTDDLAIPAFLRREGRLTDTQLKALLKPAEWVPIRAQATTQPDPTTEETDNMAKINIAITDRAAPVYVWQHGGEAPVKTFAGMDAFEAWWSPKVGRSLGGTSSAERTDIMLEELNEPKSLSAVQKAKAATVLKIAETNRKLRQFPREQSGTSPEPKSAPSDRPSQPKPGALVTVNGTEHASVKAAFETLGLPMGKRYKFRKELKIAGAKTFSHEGKDYQFKTGGK